MTSDHATGETSGHATSEQLALLAMDATVPGDVAAHVRGCEECQRDLSIVRSLLHADGPDSTNESGDHDSKDDLPSELQTAMADTSEGRPDFADDAADTDPDARDGGKLGSGPSMQRHRFNPLVAALLIAAGFAVILLLLLRS